MSGASTRIDLGGERLTEQALMNALGAFWESDGPERMPRTIRSGIFVGQLFAAWGMRPDPRAERVPGEPPVIRHTLENDLGAFPLLLAFHQPIGEVNIENTDGTVRCVLSNFTLSRSDYPELLDDMQVRELLHAALRRLAALEAK